VDPKEALREKRVPRKTPESGSRSHWKKKKKRPLGEYFVREKGQPIREKSLL